MLEQITNLEVKIAFLEGNVQEYDQLFQELYQKIDFLEQEVRRLDDESKVSGESHSIQSERPPHY